MTRPVPLATYRVQLTAQFGFADAAARLPYLAALGVSHLYTSPITQARPGSTHGYDVVDHNTLNPELGGETGFEQLATGLAEFDVGLIADFVPNHVGVGHGVNAWWLDVLEWGRRSPHAVAFDIDWDASMDHTRGVVLLPILGKAYGDALANGEIELRYDGAEGAFSAWYFDHRLPICPLCYSDILDTLVAAANAGGEPAGVQLLDIAGRYRAQPPAYEDAAQFKAAIRQTAGAAAIIARGLAAYRPDKADALRLEALHDLLERQHYRLTHWRLAATDINYRRFFDITELAGIRVENAPTFAALHRLTGDLIRRGGLHGIRLDHIDGLYDPQQYCRRLQGLIRTNRPHPAPGAPFYVVVEKILADGETMPHFPGVAGTTGYEAANWIARVLVDGSGLTPLRALAQDFTGAADDFHATLEASKQQVLDTMLASEFNALVRLLARLASEHWRSRDYSAERLRTALRLYVQHFPVYRTYVTKAGASERDRATIEGTIEAAREQAVKADGDMFDFLRDALTLDLIAAPDTPYTKKTAHRFALKVQQFTGPMMAKSLEDTALYRDVTLLALNEVGGDPSLPPLSADDFHGRMAARARDYPHAMTATATHDTKRGEDARMRILALAELHDEWGQCVGRWRTLNASCRAEGGERAPSATHEYMLYQTLIGAWPLGGIDGDFVKRIEAYAIKAAREGKRETSWLDPDEAYESALLHFARTILSHDPFQRDFESFARRVALIGALNSLSQLALKATMPGIPDFYQGTEFWDLSLVDPDNRRPVDFDARGHALRGFEDAPSWRDLAADWPDGLIKLALTHRLLALRAELPHVFLDSDYQPVEVHGPDGAHVLAFARTAQRDAMIVAVLRHFAPLTDGGRRWLSAGSLDATLKVDYPTARNLLRPDQVLPPGDLGAAELFGALPVAILHARRR